MGNGSRTSLAFALRGGGYDDVWRYSVSGNTWTSISGTPGNIHDGGALAALNGAHYAIRGDNTDNFYRLQ